MRRSWSSSSSSTSPRSRSRSSSKRTSNTATDLDLGLSMFTTTDTDNDASLFVKVYMEGHPIGRKLDILAHHCYQQLIATLDHMFQANILWGEEAEAENCNEFHVLTYEDEEGDWLMVGDVPWEMFLSTVKRLKITRACPC